MVWCAALALAGCSSGSPTAAPPSAVPSPVLSESPSPSPSVSFAPAPSVTPTDCVSRTLGRLSLEQQAGQLLMVGIGVDAPSGLGDSVRRYHLGGVFLHLAAELNFYRLFNEAIENFSVEAVAARQADALTKAGL